jgi:hypothetical protein
MNDGMSVLCGSVISHPLLRFQSADHDKSEAGSRDFIATIPTLPGQLLGTACNVLARLASVYLIEIHAFLPGVRSRDCGATCSSCFVTDL